MFRGNIEYINSLMRFSYKHIDERSEEHKNEYSKIKDRELDIIGNLKKKIPRNIETFEEFQMLGCKNPEIQFLSLVKCYNKLIEEEHKKSDFSSKKIELKGFVKSLEGNGYELLSFNIIENTEELEKVKKNFLDTLIEMIFIYLDQNYPLISYEMSRSYDINEKHIKLINKLISALERETIFAKDITAITKQYKENPEKYERKNVLETINDILNRPISIENGYVQLINQIKKEYFSSENNNNKQKINKNSPNVENSNDIELIKFNRLSEEHKKAIKDILFETPLYLKNLEYSTDDENYKALGTETEELKAIALDITNPLIKEWNSSINSKKNKINLKNKPKGGNSFVGKNTEVSNITPEHNPSEKDNHSLSKEPEPSTQIYSEDLTINQYLNLFGYEETEEDMNQCFTQCVIDNELLKIRLILRFAEINNTIIKIDESVVKYIYDNHNNYVLDYAKKHDIILNKENNTEVEYRLNPKVALKFVKRDRYELTDILVDYSFEPVSIDYSQIDLSNPIVEENRNLYKIGNFEFRIPKNIKLYHEFQMKNYRNSEIQFLRLVKDYNRMAKMNINNSEYDFKKFDFIWYTRYLEGLDTSKLIYNTIESPEDIYNVKKEYHDKSCYIFLKYLILKYGKELPSTNNILPEMKNEIIEFNEKLAKALTNEFYFTKDLTRYLNEIKNNKCLLKEMEIYVKSIHSYRLELPKCYYEIIHQINAEYFGFSINDDNLEPSLYKLNSNELNKYDKLNRAQKIVIRNIIYETPLFINNMESYYSSSYYGEDSLIIAFRNTDYKGIEPVINNIINLLQNTKVHDEIIAPKKYIGMNHKERKIDHTKEKIYYVDENNSLKEAIRKSIFISDNKNNENHSDDESKDYALPKNLKEVYVVSNEKLDENSLPVNEKIFVNYGNKFEIVSTNNEGRLIRGNDNEEYQDLHLCEQVNVIFADIKNLDANCINDADERERNPYYTVNDNGCINLDEYTKYYENEEEEILQYSFNNDTNLYAIKINSIEEKVNITLIRPDPTITKKKQKKKHFHLFSKFKGNFSHKIKEIR
jgi:hypothetical protein